MWIIWTIVTMKAHLFSLANRLCNGWWQLFWSRRWRLVNLYLVCWFWSRWIWRSSKCSNVVLAAWDIANAGDCNMLGMELWSIRILMKFVMVWTMIVTEWSMNLRPLMQSSGISMRSRRLWWSQREWLCLAQACFMLPTLKTATISTGWFHRRSRAMQRSWWQLWSNHRWISFQNWSWLCRFELFGASDRSSRMGFWKYYIDFSSGPELTECDMITDGGVDSHFKDDFNAGVEQAGIHTGRYSCGVWGPILGGYDQIAGGELTNLLSLPGVHTELRLDLLYMSLDSWDGETGYVQIDGNSVGAMPSTIWSWWRGVWMEYEDITDLLIQKELLMEL